jgi:drug/metabolite transporter (DMT)-like permease
MNNVKGILLMLAAMAGFTLEDLFVKKLSADISTGQILMMLGLGGTIAFALMARSKGHRLTARHFWTRGLMMRTVAEGFAAVTFVLSLKLIDLSTVAAVFQVTPLVITMGAALFLGEAVGWRRWMAILIGFVGVLIIIRPGMTAFDPNVGFVLAAVFFVMIRDLITRGLPANVPSTVVSFQAFVAVVISGALLAVLSATPLQSLEVNQMWFILGGMVFGVSGYYCIVAATRIGEAAVVTPFRYARLVFSLIVGFVVFHERPDMWTLLGASIVIAMGIFTVWRERMLARA